MSPPTAKTWQTMQAFNLSFVFLASNLYDKLTPGWLRVQSWSQYDGSGDVQVSHETVSWSLQETLPQDLPSSAGEGELKQTVCGVGMPVWFSRSDPYGELDIFYSFGPRN